MTVIASAPAMAGIGHKQRFLDSGRPGKPSILVGKAAVNKHGLEQR